MTRDNKTILAAWFAGVGLTVYRTVRYRQSNGQHISAPPSPGELVKTVGFFGVVALVNEMVSEDQAHRALALLAWGVDLAALINLLSGKPTPIAGGPWPPAQTPDTMILPNGSSAPAPSSNGGGGGGTPKPNTFPPAPFGGVTPPLGVPAPNQPFNPAQP